MRVLGLAAALWLAGTGAALADPVALPSIPPQIQNSPIVQSVLDAVGNLLQTTNGNTAHGKVTYFRRFDLQVETAPNVYRQVHLHQGTVINPRGATLTPGMTVDVSGSAQSDHSLNADTITAR
ncbi:MAG TPA: hypothetical protein VIK27_02045 [Candidatus Aquilonibacter sp.]